jgi:hypothetical protein
MAVFAAGCAVIVGGCASVLDPRYVAFVTALAIDASFSPTAPLFVFDITQ